MATVPRALVVDDDTVSRLVLAHMLRRAGWEVTEADDIGPAAELAQTSEFTAVFSDFSMPGGTGMDLLAALPAPQPLFVLITGIVQHVTAGADPDHRIDAQLTKPISTRALNTVLNTIPAAAAGPVTITGSTRRSRLWLLAGWALAGALVAVAGVRLIRPETLPLLIGIQGVAVWLLVPALPLAVVAALRRKWALTAVAAVIAVGQVGWVAAAIGWHGAQAAPAGYYQLHLQSANVQFNNARIADLAAELARSNADVVLLQEVTPEILVAIEQTALWSAYPERVLDPLPGFHGSAILSRLPITAGRAIDVAGYPMSRADVTTPAGTVRIVNVHVVAPVNEVNTPRWRAQLDALAVMQPPAGSSLILAGDFNATVDHGPFQRVLAGGKRDAFLLAGSGYGATWPQWAGPVFPVMRLDHVLISADLTALEITDLDNPGSDHRRLQTVIAVPAAR